MRYSIRRNIAIFVLALATTACERTAPSPPAKVADGATPIAGWLGTWKGPEGTWLRIARQGDGYRVTIRDLDRETTFPLTVLDGRAHFERAGRREELHATDGAATGMKWLAEKRDCLTVAAGEGYCRD